MNPRLLIGIVVGLVMMALGGFVFLLKPHSNDGLIASAPPVVAQPAASSSAAATPVAAAPPPPSPPPPPPPMATPASIEAEVSLSENADLLALLKKNFNAEYNDLLAGAARRRNEGASDQAFTQDLEDRFQAIMRGKLKYGVGASMSAIDRLAANEASLFHALGTEGAALCLKMLGRDDAPTTAPPPESVRQLMRLGTLYRFQAISEGMSNTKPVGDLTADERRAFEASLAREGLNFKDVSAGAYLNKGSAEPGRPCLTLETLHLAISRLAEGNRRKIYAGMFFLGRDN